MVLIARFDVKSVPFEELPFVSVAAAGAFSNSAAMHEVAATLYSPIAPSMKVRRPNDDLLDFF
jgi:hypothetical protein